MDSRRSSIRLHRSSSKHRFSISSTPMPLASPHSITHFPEGVNIPELSSAFDSGVVVRVFGICHRRYGQPHYFLNDQKVKKWC
jgi:hypothetical protein